jgi:hypothetical protein
MDNFIQLSITDTVQALSKSRRLIEPKVLEYMEPFMFTGSLTPGVDAELTDNARLLPTATMKDMETFIDLNQQLWPNSFLLLGKVQGVLEYFVSVCDSSSDCWHTIPTNFRTEDFFVRFKELVASKARSNNNSNTTSKKVVSKLSFADLSKLYFWLGKPLLKAKKDISKSFGIASPDILSLGLRAVSKLRNTDAHISPSCRETIEDKPFSAESGVVMLNPWISGKCNLGKYYGKLCFLVYITTDFPDSGVQTARREIKALLQRMPKMIVNYLGIPSGWLNEPLWANI